MAEDSGETLESGMVIEDAGTVNGTEKQGNQFVWVPVNQTLTFSNSSGEEKGKIELGRYEITKGQEISGPDTIGTTVIKSYFTESSRDSVARNIEEFKRETKNAKGYYIGRYEMGIEGAIYDTNEKKWTENTDESKNVVCQRDKTVYNNITRDEALKESQNLYNNVKGMYTSDLINSYAWDTAIIYLNKCSGTENYAFQEENVVGGDSASRTGSKNDEPCNINDMSKNVREWTTEYSSYNNGRASSCASRGGEYKNGHYAGYRNWNEISQKGEIIGFRSILYLNS